MGFLSPQMECDAVKVMGQIAPAQGRGIEDIRTVIVKREPELVRLWKFY